MSDKIAYTPLDGTTTYDFGDSTPGDWPRLYVSAEAYQEVADANREWALNDAKTRTRLKEIRRALGDYVASEGCSCCQNTEAHEEAAKRLGKLLRVKLYDDGTGHNFYAYKSVPKGGIE